MPNPRAATRRSALAQTRSQDTRRKLIRAALGLWNERGFEEAFESTTAEEIARAAGVSKGTFYFHFAHKEDVLFEMSWATAELMVQEAAAAMADGVAPLELADRLMSSLARRVARAPRAAVLRVTTHASRWPHTGSLPANGHSFGEAWTMIATYARDGGHLPPDVDVDELGLLLQAVTMDALVVWASSRQSAASLRASLCRRAEIVLKGAGDATWTEPTRRWGHTGR
jgi:AcrR family transcriptional regulator